MKEYIVDVPSEIIVKRKHYKYKVVAASEKEAILACKQGCCTCIGNYESEDIIFLKDPEDREGVYVVKAKESNK